MLARALRASASLQQSAHGDGGPASTTTAPPPPRPVSRCVSISRASKRCSACQQGLLAPVPRRRALPRCQSCSAQWRPKRRHYRWRARCCALDARSRTTTCASACRSTAANTTQTPAPLHCCVTRVGALTRPAAPSRQVRATAGDAGLQRARGGQGAQLQHTPSVAPHLTRARRATGRGGSADCAARGTRAAGAGQKTGACACTGTTRARLSRALTRSATAALLHCFRLLCTACTRPVRASWTSTRSGAEQAEPQMRGERRAAAA